MDGTRIPLELIQKVFFGDDDGKSEESRAFQAGEANDFKVHKNPDPPLPKEIKPPPYPRMERKTIPSNVPSAYYHQKRVIEPEPEYVPPPPVHPRPIDVSKLSKFQKELAKRGPFEQDIYIIEQKRKAEKRRNRVHKYKITPISEETLERYNKHDNSEKVKRENNNNYNVYQSYDPFRKKCNEPERLWMNEREKCEMIGQERRLAAENADRIKPIEYYLTEDFIPNRKTIATKLKEDFVRREIQRQEVEERRQKLNEEMRQKTEEEIVKRLQARPMKFNTKAMEEKAMRDKKQKLHENEETYRKQLQTQYEALALGQTLLERVENELLQK